MLAAAVTACAFASAAVTAQPTNGRASHAPRRVAQSAPAAPVVVELFTAQGCAACVEANAVVERAAAKAPRLHRVAQAVAVPGATPPPARQTE